MKMTQKKLIAFLLIILGAITIGLGVYTYQENNQLSVQTATNVSTQNVSCHESPRYFAVSKNIKDSVGSDVVVKYKTSTYQNIPCSYTVEKTDFEVKNQQAEYFMVFTNNFLILDSGTGPEPRALIVYDLQSRKKVYTDSYSKPITAENDTLVYWNPTKAIATTLNCPKLNDFSTKGLRAIVEAKVSLNLATLTKKELGQYQCVAKQ